MITEGILTAVWCLSMGVALVFVAAAAWRYESARQALHDERIADLERRREALRARGEP